DEKHAKRARHAARCRRLGGVRLGAGEPRGEPEARAAAELALDADLAAHELRELPCDREPEPGAAVFPRERGVDLAEGLEDAGLLLRRDADAGIEHGEGEQNALLVAAGEHEVDVDLAVLRELDG